MIVPTSLLIWYFGIHLVLFVSFTCSLIWHIRYEFFVMKRTLSKYNVCLLIMGTLMFIGTGTTVLYPVESIIANNVDGSWRDTPFNFPTFLVSVTIRGFCFFAYVAVYSYIVYLRSSSIVASRPPIERKMLSFFVGLVILLENYAWISILLQGAFGIQFPVLMTGTYVGLYAGIILNTIEIFYLYHFISYVWGTIGGTSKDKLLIIAYYGCYISTLHIVGCCFVFATLIDKSNMCYLVGVLANYTACQLNFLFFLKMTYEIDQLKTGKSLSSNNSKPHKASEAVRVISSSVQEDNTNF